MTMFGRRNPLKAPPAPMVASAETQPLRRLSDAAPVELAARLLASRRDMERRLERALDAASQAHGRGVRLKPHLLLPEKIWRGRYGKFLLHALTLNPYDPWNVVILPADGASAALCGAPTPPPADDPEILARCAETIAAARSRYVEAQEQVEWTNDYSDLETALAGSVAAVKAFAQQLRTELVGEPEPHAEETPTGADGAPHG